MKRSLQNIVTIFIGTAAVALSLTPCAHAAAFLDNGSAARSEAMGRSVTALADDLDAYYYNPAGYAYQKHAKLNTMYAKQMDQFNVYYTGYGTRFLNGYIATNLYMLRLEDIPQTNYNDGTFTSAGSDFEYASKAVFISYGMPLRGVLRDRASIGVNIKYLNETLFNNQATGMGIDLGMLYRFTDDVRFGIMAVNLLQPVMTWDTDSGHQDIVERKYKAGLAYTGFRKFILTTDLTFLKHDVLSGYGIEYLLNEFFSLRGGYTGMSYTFGLGLHYAHVNFDYVYMKDTETVIDDTHKFSIGYMFGSGDDVLVPGMTAEKTPEPVREEVKIPEPIPAAAEVPATQNAAPADLFVTEDATVPSSGPVTENKLFEPDTLFMP